MSKPFVHILVPGSAQPLARPRLPKAVEVHATTGLIIYASGTAKKGMIIDPGLAADFYAYEKALSKYQLTLADITHVLITHFHQDHVQSVGKFLDGTHIFHYGASAILGTNEYGAAVYTNGYVETPEICFALYDNAHTKKDTVYIIDSENEGKVAFVGDLAFSLFDRISKENQKAMDQGSSVNPEARRRALSHFLETYQDVTGFYLGHYYRKINQEELKSYLSAWLQ